VKYLAFRADGLVAGNAGADGIAVGMIITVHGYLLGAEVIAPAIQAYYTVI